MQINSIFELTPERRTSIEVRFWSKVEFSEKCWFWRANTHPSGYGLFHLMHGSQNRAHRVAYELATGSRIPDGLTIDHLCRNRGCVNPQHLEAVSIRENVLRGDTVVAANAMKRFCKNGHPLEGDNLVRAKLKQGRRICRICENRRDLAYHYNHRDEKLRYMHERYLLNRTRVTIEG